MQNYNYIDLFHGIGGFALGAAWAGMKFKNHFCSDIEPYCQKLYKLRFPGSVQLGDIKNIDTEELKKHGTGWIITGGFPCQDISIAGKGGGITGDRSGLWFEYWRLIRDLRPRFAIMENVGMLVRRGLREVLGSLAEIGYNAEWQDIRAEDVGAPHRRERIWIVAYPDGNGWDKESFGEFSQAGKSKIEAKFSDKRTKDEMADTNGERYIHRQDEVESTNTWELTQWDAGAKGQISNTGCTGLSKSGQEQDGENRFQRGRELTASCWWEIEPSVGRLVNGLPGRVDRLKGLGNAIVPHIAQLLFEAIKLNLEEKL